MKNTSTESKLWGKNGLIIENIFNDFRLNVEFWLQNYQSYTLNAEILSAKKQAFDSLLGSIAESVQQIIEKLQKTDFSKDELQEKNNKLIKSCENLNDQITKLRKELSERPAELEKFKKISSGLNINDLIKDLTCAEFVKLRMKNLNEKFSAFEENSFFLVTGYLDQTIEFLETYRSHCDEKIKDFIPVMDKIHALEERILAEPLLKILTEFKSNFVKEKFSDLLSRAEKKFDITVKKFSDDKKKIVIKEGLILKLLIEMGRKNATVRNSKNSEQTKEKIKTELIADIEYLLEIESVDCSEYREHLTKARAEMVNFLNPEGNNEIFRCINSYACGHAKELLSADGDIKFCERIFEIFDENLKKAEIESCVNIVTFFYILDELSINIDELKEGEQEGVFSKILSPLINIDSKFKKILNPVSRENFSKMFKDAGSSITKVKEEFENLVKAKQEFGTIILSPSEDSEFIERDSRKRMFFINMMAEITILVREKNNPNLNKINIEERIESLLKSKEKIPEMYFRELEELEEMVKRKDRDELLEKKANENIIITFEPLWQLLGTKKFFECYFESFDGSFKEKTFENCMNITNRLFFIKYFCEWSQSLEKQARPSELIKDQKDELLQIFTRIGEKIKELTGKFKIEESAEVREKYLRGLEKIVGETRKEIRDFFGEQSKALSNSQYISHLESSSLPKQVTTSNDVSENEFDNSKQLDNYNRMGQVAQEVFFLNIVIDIQSLIRYKHLPNSNQQNGVDIEKHLKKLFSLGEIISEPRAKQIKNLEKEITLNGASNFLTNNDMISQILAEFFTLSKEYYKEFFENYFESLGDILERKVDEDKVIILGRMLFIGICYKTMQELGSITKDKRSDEMLSSITKMEKNIAKLLTENDKLKENGNKHLVESDFQAMKSIIEETKKKFRDFFSEENHLLLGNQDVSTSNPVLPLKATEVITNLNSGSFSKLSEQLPSANYNSERTMTEIAPETNSASSDSLKLDLTSGAAFSPVSASNGKKSENSPEVPVVSNPLVNKPEKKSFFEKITSSIRGFFSSICKRLWSFLERISGKPLKNIPVETKPTKEEIVRPEKNQNMASSGQSKMTIE